MRLLRLLGFLRRYKLWVALAILLGVTTVVSNIGLLALAAYLIAAAALQPLLASLSIPIYLVRVFGISRGFSRYFERLVSHGVTFRLLRDLRTWCYGRLQPLSPARLGGYRSGDLLSRVVGDVEELENVYLRILSPVVVALLVCGLTFAVFYFFSPVLALVALGFLLLAGIGVPLLVMRLSRRAESGNPALRGELDSRMVEGVQGSRDILAFGREDDKVEGVRGTNTALGRVQRRTAFVGGLEGSLNDLLANLAMLALLVLSIPLVTGGEVRGVYLAFLALVILSAFEAITPLSAASRRLSRSLAAGERLFELTDGEPEIEDPELPARIPGSPSLEFERVRFRYAEGELQALKGVSLALQAGEKVAVVGHSGSGKSTLASLALRFYDPQDGEVRLGGQDVRSLAQEDLREQIAYVPQSVYLFSGSLQANLLLAKTDAADDELRQALQRAQLPEFADRLDERIGEQGARLSGGEKRRVGVARALLREAPLLVLDEPTADLDTLTERRLLDSVLEERRGVLLITHRLVGMDRMDRVIVLEGGEVVERGSHRELSASGGLYASMLAAQNRMIAA